jgi:flagellar hook assembly protein FlgD/fibronectin type 3 domain-containing protein
MIANLTIKISNLYALLGNFTIVISRIQVDNIYSADIYYDCDKRNLWSGDSKKFHLLELYGADGPGLWVVDLETPLLRWLPIVGVTSDQVMDQYSRVEVVSYWMPDSRTIAVPVRKPTNAYGEWTQILIDVETGAGRETPLTTRYYDQMGFSPQGNYLFFNDRYQWYRPLSIFGAYLNLRADLVAVPQAAQVLLKGAAVDLHFSGWQLEYADVGSPDAWTLIQPFSETPVINDTLASWVPPHEGTYNIRLTAWDKAGNRKQVVKRVTWGERSPIANLYRTQSVFSPNGDGIKDTVEFKFTVTEPVQLEFLLYDANHRLVRRFTRSHPLTGEQALAWDGTDEQGQRVGDGLYRLKALDYELLVEVDTTPPDLALAAAFAAEGINAGLTGHADDKNLATWQIVYRPAGGSGDWTSLRQGTDALGRKPASPLATLATDNVTIAGLDATKLTLYGGKVFRLSAEDRAGNRASVLAGPLEERLAIYAWDQKWLDTNVLPAAWTRPEQHLIEAFETIGAPLAQVALEYRIGTAWQEAATGFDVSEAGIAVSWDTASAGAAPNAIRLKLVDVTGAVLYSNTLTTQNLFEIGVDCGSTPAGSNYLFEEVSRLSFRVQRETNGPWVEYASTGGGAAGTVPVGAFLMPPPDGGGEVRLKAAAETRTGRSYESNTIIWPPRCAGVSVTLGSPLPAAGCGAASGSRTLNADVTLAGGAAVTPQQLNLYRQTGAGWEVLKSFGAALQGSATVDTSAYPEGAQEFRLAFRYLDENGRGQERSAQLTLAVDRTLPVAEISYPSAAGQLLCPLKIAAPTGDRLAIPVQGLISDETDVQQYQLFYAAGENPGNWLPARTWVASQPGEIKGAGPLAGDLGLWDITGLPAGRYALKLQVGDAAGNGACHTVALDLRPPAQVARLALSEKIFSPNGDGSKDAVTIDYLLTEAASLKVEVYSLAKQGDSSQALSGSPVKIITSGLLQPAGAGAMQWDGTGEGGHPVADGKYVVVATATDVCGVDFRKTAFVEVDGAAPQVVLSAPAAGQSVGSIVEARGSAQDPHFSGYQLEAGEGAAPESWTTLAAGSHPVVNGLFGVWNNFGLEGLWTLRLSADDEAGNRATATVPLDLGERVALLKDFSVAPAVFSPNGDGRSDTVLVAYELNAPGEVLLEFVNEAGQVAATVSRSAPAAGTYSSVWDGKAADGALLADGDYQVRLTATAAANPAVRQEESLSLALDNTPPVVEIPNPQDQAYLSATTLAVSGRIEDRRLVDYALKLAGPQGELLLDAGRQNRAGHTFAVLESLPEGAYTFSATATDAAGNVTQLPRSFVIDRTPPVLSFSAPAAGAFFTAEDAAILLSGTVLEPNLSRYSLQVGSGQAPLHWQELTAGEALPGGSISHRWPFAGQNLPDGLYTLRLQARDKAGLEATVSNTLAIDSQPPQVGLTAPPSGGYVTAPFDVAGAASDANLTTFRLAISEGDCATAAKWALLREGNEPVAAGVLYSMPALPRDGAYCLRLSASDRPGHEAQALSGFTIDTRPPAAPQLSGRVENRTGARLEWTAGGEPDLAGFRLYRDGQPLEQALPPQLTLLDAGLAEGTHVYQAQAVDFAGNASALSEAVALIIDTTPPTVQLTSPAAGARLGGVVEIRGSAYSADDFREYRLYVGAGAEPARQLLRRSPVPTLNGTLAQWDASGLGEGAFTLRLEGEDLRGNLAVHEIVVTIDNVPPPAPHLHDVVVSGNRVDLTWEGGAADDLAGYLVYRNGRLANAGGLATASVKPWLVASLAYADANVPDGTHDYTVVAVDTAGNQSVPSNIRTVQIETRAPAVQIVAPADNSKFEFQTLVKAASPDEDVASVRFQYKRLETGDWTDLPPAGFSDPYRTYLDPAALGLSYGSVQLRATATDRAGNTGPHSPVVNLSHTDLTPPAPPAVLTARVDGDRVLLQWPGNGEADVAGYHVYRSGGESPIRLNDLLLPSPGFADAGLVDNLYAYAVTAVDQFGNESAASAAAVARVYAPVLLQPDKEIGQPTAAIDGYGVEPEAQVELFREPAAGTVSVGTVVADAAGRFRLTEILLVDGENRLTARATDALGNGEPD